MGQDRVKKPPGTGAGVGGGKAQKRVYPRPENGFPPESVLTVHPDWTILTMVMMILAQHMEEKTCLVN